MAEGARLESVFTLTCNEGSNPSLSATVADPVAHTDDDDVFFVSEPDSGYSVDNLAPGTPTILSAFSSGNDVELIWESLDDEDFSYYAVYRGNDLNFEPTEPIAAVIDTFFTDANIQADEDYFYRLSAYDYNGNESEISEPIQIQLLSTNDRLMPETFRLHANHPNLVFLPVRQK